MFKDLISRLFNRPKSVSNGQSGLGTELLPLAVHYPLDRLVPIILPLELAAMDWPGPIIPLGDLPFSVAWAALTEPNKFSYVSREAQAEWDASGIDWRVRAMQNLARIARHFPFLEKCDERGEPFVKALITEDAMGPSRLLLPDFFKEELGDEYMVAIPEQTCAIAYRSDLTEEQRVTVDEWINGCYHVGREPMSDARFQAKRFWVL